MEMFYWFDDDNNARKTTAENMAHAIGREIKFFDLHGKDLENYVNEIIQNNEPPALLILDQNLQNAQGGVFVHGSTLAAYIRERWADCPIVCVTAQDLHELSIQQKGLFEEVFPDSRISASYPVVMALAEGFATLSAHKPSKIEDVLTIVGVPQEEASNFLMAIPTMVKESIKTQERGNITKLATWIRHVLFKRPGFLYDEMWLSTLIGIKHTSLPKVVGLFDDAKYNGVFASESPRWWRSLVIDIVGSHALGPELPWEAGRRLPGITEDDFSICEASGEPFPETVAYLDTTNDLKRVQMKLKHTILHSDYEVMLYFEDIRLMDFK